MISSRYNDTTVMQGIQQQQQHPQSQFQEGQPILTESSEWNHYNEQTVKHATGSVSSFKNWSPTDLTQQSGYPSAYSQTAYHPGTSQQPHYQSPPRVSSVSYSTTRNRSNSNGSNLSASYGYSSNGSHASQHSSVNSYAQYPSHYQQQQPLQQQQWQYQGYQDNTPAQPFISNGVGSYDANTIHGYSSYNNTDGSENHMVEFHKQQQQQQQQQQQGFLHQQQQPSPLDTSFSSVSRTFQQEALTSQLIDQTASPQSSPRVTHRLAQKRRDHTTATSHLQTIATTEENDLPSLDEYEEMLQKMTSPGLGPTSPREPRAGLRRLEYDRDREARVERAARQTRRLQQQQQQQQQQQPGQLRSEPMPEPSSFSSITRPNNEQESNGLLPVSAEVRKLRRRSSLPMSFGEAPKNITTDGKKRSSGLQHSPMGIIPSENPTTLRAHPASEDQNRNNNRHSWEDESITPRDDLLYGRNQEQPQNADGAVKKFLLHADEDDSRSIRSNSSERQPQNRRDSGDTKPPVSMKSQLRLSRTPSQTDVEEISILVVADEQEEGSSSSRGIVGSPKIDEGDRQPDHYFRNGAGSPRGQPFTNPRSRTATPLGMVSEETTVTFTVTPNRQQLLASMDDGLNAIPPPSKSTPPNSLRSRPTTPISGIRPPAGPAPMPTTSAPISANGQSLSSAPLPSITGYSRKVSPGGRRVKPSPPGSGSILPPMTSRPRAGSVASISSMSSITSITMDSALQQAPPSLPLPSVPPPPPSSSCGTSEMASQRRRKASGGKELVLPTAQLLSESIAAGRLGQESLPTPASSLPMSPELGALSLSNASGSPQSHQVHISRLKKRVSSLEKELETLGKELSSRSRNGDELHFKTEQLTIERDALEKQVSILQDYVFKDREDDPELRQALKQIQDDKDERQRECLTRQENPRSETVGSAMMPISEGELLKMQAERSELKREATECKDEIQRLRNQLSELEQDATRDQKVRQELELKMEALQQLQQGNGASLDNSSDKSNGNNNNDTLQQELKVLRSERLEHQEARTSLEARLQQEEVQYRTLQDNVLRLTSKLTHVESQHESEIKQIQRDHEEVMEKVVIEHANALMELSEQSKTESEREFRRERQESLARERIMTARLKEQSTRNDALEERLIKLEQSQSLLEEERESWIQAKKSLERQLGMEQLQRQEDAYRTAKVEKENERLRAILSDLDLVALMSSEGDDEPYVKSNEGEDPSKEKEKMKALYESQRQRWADQMRLLERKMAKAEEAAAEIMQKNMELMVALDLAQSS
ncbi:hypothetical protein BGX21_009355 [Mortierella sp. AD011]|nr:hypothetical protein BGX20_009814 [Mortierella sp. AD010]KAF9396954.1 hypothetical protein BGX21_009355 [Mortierella sp. AD011]